VNTPRLTPSAVAKLGTTAFLAGGEAHTVVRLTTGALRAWGSNTDGELGNGTTTKSPVPVAVG
jgi:alpha-tubulin suppressor-like RCC1 family protein